MAEAIQQRAKGHVDKTVSFMKEDVSKGSNVLAAAASSTTWVYPIRGIYYLASTKHVYNQLQGPIVKSLILSVVVFLLAFALTYLPIVAFMTLFSGPLSFILAVPVVLSEAYIVSLFLARTFYIEPALEDTFDSVLLAQGHEDLVSKGRQIKGKGATKSLGRALSRPLRSFSPQAIARYLISLPLNAIPGVGTAFFILYNGYKGGPSHHARYFQLKGLSKEQERQFIKQHQGSYTAFGSMALVLGLIPFAGLALSFASTAGAALWASDLEKKNALESMGGSGSDAKSSQRSGQSQREL